MQLSDEKILSIGGISLSLGILISRFLHFKYTGFSVRFCWRNSRWVITSNEPNISNQKKKEAEHLLKWNLNKMLQYWKSHVQKVCC